MEETDHVLLVGKGAQDFARMMGFTIEDDLTRRCHGGVAGMETANRSSALRPAEERGKPAGRRHWRDAKRSDIRITMQMAAEGLIDPEHICGTINCNGVNSQGRGLRRYHHQRSVVQNPWPGRRFTDSRRRPLRRRRVRRGRLDRAGRTEPGQPGLVHLRRRDAARQSPQGCRNDRDQAHQGDGHSETSPRR